jgi:hypothetical protein
MKVAAVSLGAAGAVVGHYILKSRDAIAYHDDGHSRVIEPATILRGHASEGSITCRLTRC